MEEVKSSSKIVLRSKDAPAQQNFRDPFMIVSSIGCLSSIYMKSQYLLFGFLLLLLSLYVVSKRKNFSVNSLMPLYGLIPSLFKMTVDVIRCLVTGEPL